MLITVDELKNIYSDKDFSKFTDDRLKRKLSAIENLIREHTHNAFINRNTITKCYSENGMVHGDFQYLNIDDTVLLYNSGVNDGLYVVIGKYDDNTIELDNTIHDFQDMKLAKVEYPLDIIEGCVELLDYDLNYSSNQRSGIASESISRHSVSYVQLNNGNSLNGYPVHLLGFLKKYTKWRT